MSIYILDSYGTVSEEFYNEVILPELGNEENSGSVDDLHLEEHEDPNYVRTIPEVLEGEKIAEDLERRTQIQDNGCMAD